MATIFVPKEVAPGETRVAATPDSVERLLKDNHTVIIESGAGELASFSDEDYRKSGAQISTDPGKALKDADVVLRINPPQKNDKLGKHEAEAMKEGALLISFLYPTQNEDVVDKLAKAGASAFALDQLPRTLTRAQKMDGLSSQANLAGYKAVLLAAEKLPKIFPLMMTPSGTIRPAKVVIIGAGVAGLQAVATAKRLGAIVEVSDVRPETKEQVESLGGKFIWVEGAKEGEGGYAAEQSKEFLDKQKAEVRKHIVEADVVITTALVPGRKAPVLVTKDVVKDMKTGSVIVDIATSQGGNCELSEKDKTVVKEGVTIIGIANIPATVPVHASQMIANNLLAAIQDRYPKGEDNGLDFSNEVFGKSVVTFGGKRREQVVEEPPAKEEDKKDEKSEDKKSDDADKKDDKAEAKADDKKSDDGDKKSDDKKDDKKDDKSDAKAEDKKSDDDKKDSDDKKSDDDKSDDKSDEKKSDDDKSDDKDDKDKEGDKS